MLLCSTAPGHVESDENGTAKNCPQKKQSKNFFSRSLPPSSLVPSPDIPERTWRFIAGVGGLLQVWAEECEPGEGVVMVEGVCAGEHGR